MLIDLAVDGVDGFGLEDWEVGLDLLPPELLLDWLVLSPPPQAVSIIAPKSNATPSIFLVFIENPFMSTERKLCSSLFKNMCSCYTYYKGLFIINARGTVQKLVNTGSKKAQTGRLGFNIQLLI